MGDAHLMEDKTAFPTHAVIPPDTVCIDVSLGSVLSVHHTPLCFSALRFSYASVAHWDYRLVGQS